MRVSPFKVNVRLKHTDRCHFLRFSETTVTATQLVIPEVKGSAIKEQNFTFDLVMQGSTSELYVRGVKDSVLTALDGYNACILAYGATGAGKTHTVFGDLQLPTATEPGLLVLALTDLLSTLQASEHSVRMSYLEVYNEHVKDLLSDLCASPKEVAIMEDMNGVVLPDLTTVSIQSLEAAESLLKVGSERRKMAETGANQFSTRAHAVVQLYVERFQRDGSVERLTVGKLSMVDLAGSERLAKTGNRGDRLVEAGNINRSLLTLSTCITVLSDPKMQDKFVPYRNSKLTRLLKDSLGGNSLTVFVACISPCPSTLDSTLQTLRYAHRARSIRNSVARNVKEIDVVDEDTSLAEVLRQELSALRTELKLEFENIEARSQARQVQVLLEIHEERVSPTQKHDLEQQLMHADAVDRIRIEEDIDQMTRAVEDLRREAESLCVDRTVADCEILELYEIVKKLHLEKLLAGLTVHPRPEADHSPNELKNRSRSQNVGHPHRSVTPKRHESPTKTTSVKKSAKKVAKPQNYSSIEKIRSQILKKLKG